jgi:AbrB family looped-hinge helix DNA binding protein
MKTSKVGKRGAVIVPARLRRKFGIREGGLIVAEERAEGILIRPAVALPVEVYSPERRAEFLLSNAVGEKDYRAAAAEVRKMGLDPARLPHHRPGRSRGRQGRKRA